MTENIGVKDKLHMTKQSHYWENTLRNPKVKKMYVPQCSEQHYLQQLGHGSNLNVHQQIKKQWYIYTIEYYQAIKRNTSEPVLMRWMNRELIIQSEVSQKEKDKYHIFTHTYGIQKNSIDELIFRTEMKMQTQNRLVDTAGEGEAGVN